MADPRDKKYRQLAAQEQSQRCFYCGFPMWIDAPESFAKHHGLSPREVIWFQCTAEHLKPRRVGGTSARANIAAACLRCNMLRHHRSSSPSWEQFREMVRTRIKHQRWHPRHLHALLQPTAAP